MFESTICLNAAWVGYLTASGTKTLTQKTLESFVEICADSFQVCFSDNDLMEINVSGVSKQQVLENLALILGIEQNTVTAVGDSENDISMLSWAGRGIAMGNAVPELKLGH